MDFNNSNEKVCIICPIHGEFWQTANYHMYGGNCPKCTGGMRLSKEDFIKKAKAIHGDKYDYTKVIYKNYSTKVEIVCKEHGSFLQTPNNHLLEQDVQHVPKVIWKAELRQFLIRNQIKFEQEKTFPWLKYNYVFSFYIQVFDFRILIHLRQLNYIITVFTAERIYCSV